MKNKKYLIIAIFLCIMIFPHTNIFGQKYLDMVDKDAVEMTELRTPYSKTFLNSDDSRTTLIFVHRVHDFDKDGYLQDIPEEEIDVTPPLVSNPINPLEYSTIKRRTDAPYLTYSQGFVQQSAGLEPIVFDIYTVDREYIVWHTNDIPYGSTVSNVTFNLSSTPYTSNTNPVYNIVKLSSNPKFTSADDNFNHLYGGSGAYSTNVEKGVVTLNYNNTHQFTLDLQDRLTQNSSDSYMYMGLKNNNESSVGDRLDFTWVNNQYEALVVTYTPPAVIPTLTVSPVNTLPPTADFVTVTTTSSIPTTPITYNITNSSGSNWITITNTSGTPITSNSTVTPNNTFRIYFTANTATTTRPATITLHATTPSSGVTDQVINLTQSGTISSLVVSPTSWTPSVNGGNSGNISVSNANPTIPLIYLITPQDTWLSATPMSGQTPSLFTISASPNTTGTQRVGSIKIETTPPVDGSPKYVTVTQDPIPNTVTLPLQEVVGQTSYYALDWITANNFTVSNTGNVSSLYLQAQNKITLSPGFHAAPSTGFQFKAVVQTFMTDNLSEVIPEKESKEILALKDDKYVRSKGKTGLTTDNISVDPIPTEYDLFQNYPNPFNPSTTIRFALPERAIVKIAVYNLLGQQVAEIANTELNAGYHSVNFNGSALSSGIYLYRISTEKFNKTLKLLLVK